MANERRLVDASQFRGKHQVSEVNGKLTSVVCYADIVNAPTVDAVEVVRCESCEFYGKGFGKVENCLLFPGLVGPGPEDYCSYGRRKENANAKD